MTIPIDRLYHYIENILKDIHGDTVIYRFSPHGSKKLEDLKPLHHLDWITRLTAPPIVCHDQEPLNFEFYENYPVFADTWSQWQKKYHCNQVNLKQSNIFDATVLLHSEQRSADVEKYQQAGYIPVYYWSHAIIAQDWFRFAYHVQQRKQIQKTFLIYNRSWAGTREYRVKFAELLHEKKLSHRCQTSFNLIDPEHNTHVDQHVFKNAVWKPCKDMTDLYATNCMPSTSSADFNLEDYEATQVEVVLETLFDDSRWHLTEKTLRPIACGQPFILAATPGSLKYLQSYGFKTYHNIWDESYDSITDPYQRLLAIMNVMQEISDWDAETANKKIQQAQEIANFNKSHFFSSDFFVQVNVELTRNLTQAMNQLVQSNTSAVFIERRKQQCQHHDLKQVLTGKIPHPSGEPLIPCEPGKEATLCSWGIVQVLKAARYYYNKKHSID